MENLFKIPMDLYYKTKIIAKWPTLSPFMKEFYRVMWGDFTLTGFVNGHPIMNTPPHSSPEMSGVVKAELIKQHQYRVRSELLKKVMDSNDLQDQANILVPMAFVPDGENWHSIDHGDERVPIFIYTSDEGTISVELLLTEWPLELLEDKTEYRWYKFNMPVSLTVRIGTNESTSELVIPIQVELYQAYSTYMPNETFADVIKRIKEENDHDDN